MSSSIVDINSGSLKVEDKIGTEHSRGGSMRKLGLLLKSQLAVF